MDADRIELLRRLFAAATEVIENAHESAIFGQNPRPRLPCLIKAADRLSTAGHDLTSLAETMKILARRA